MDADGGQAVGGPGPDPDQLGVGAPPGGGRGSDQDRWEDHAGADEPDWRRGAGRMAVPRVRPFRNVVVARLYCGPRRPGDFQEAAESVAEAVGGGKGDQKYCEVKAS